MRSRWAEPSPSGCVAGTGAGVLCNAFWGEAGAGCAGRGNAAWAAAFSCRAASSTPCTLPTLNWHRVAISRTQARCARSRRIRRSRSALVLRGAPLLGLSCNASARIASGNKSACMTTPRTGDTHPCYGPVAQGLRQCWFGGHRGERVTAKAGNLGGEPRLCAIGEGRTAPPIAYASRPDFWFWKNRSSRCPKPVVRGK